MRAQQIGGNNAKCDALYFDSSSTTENVFKLRMISWARHVECMCDRQINTLVGKPQGKNCLPGKS
jgi:hypothetical protein